MARSEIVAGDVEALGDARMSRPLLAVPESWLRRQVTAQLVPHTRLGKHLRFSHADLVLAAAAAARPAAESGR